MFKPIIALICGFILAVSVAAAPESSIRFAVIGDYGKASTSAAAVADMVIGWNPDFIITTGDNNYDYGEAATIDANIGQYYHAFIHPYIGDYGDGAIVNRFFPSLGNHDWGTTDAQPYLDYFTLPGNERYYDFIQGAVHFFALDADFQEPDSISNTSVQADWLREGLANSTATWQIVYMHISPYSSGRHGSAPIMQWDYAGWGADAVLSGHDHIYERLSIDGIPYFVNGVGGSSLYNIASVVPGSIYHYNNNFGAMLVEADDDAITFEFYSIWEGGTLLDSLTLTAQ
ncbi:MAG: metallophosphoesterase [Chloroflexota bacterium]|nr:metallophosphoesterase [Chloroflexota bacterium]